MVTLWYPARPTRGAPDPYLDRGVARIADRELEVPAGTFEAARSHARAGAALLRANRPYPVVLYSPGFGSWRNASTALVEQLVSNGFIVVTIDHPFDAAAVEFPNGSIVEGRALSVLSGSNVLTYEAWQTMVDPFLRVRVADVGFVLDALERLDAGHDPDANRRPLPSGLAGALDLDRVGMFGHSLGGATTAQIMRVDRRIRAGLSLDGPIPEAHGKTPCVERPFVLIRSQDPAIERLTVPSWASPAAGLCGRRSVIVLKGAGHNDFTDLAVFARDLAIDPRQRAAWALGSIGAAAAVNAERRSIVCFFDRWLRN